MERRVRRHGAFLADLSCAGDGTVVPAGEEWEGSPARPRDWRQAPAYDPQNWKHSNERILADVSPRDKQAIDAKNAEIDRQVAELRKQIAALRHPLERKRFEAKLATLPEATFFRRYRETFGS